MGSENEEELMGDEEREEIEDKELINIVRANPFLYKKSEKLYSNNEVKRLSWATIGAGLSKKKTGPEVEHRFLQLRQRFAKEKKKIIQSQGRSGAGANYLTYTPTWGLYNDLMFLVDVIKHRSTTTNYKKKLPTTTVPETVLYNTAMHSPSTSISSCYLSTPSVYNENLTVFTEDDVSKHSDIIETCAYAEDPLLLSTNIITVPENKQRNMSSAKKIEQVMTSACKKSVPEPDLFAQSKKRKDTFNKAILQESNHLNVLAQKVGDALLTCTSEPASVTPHAIEFLSSSS